MQFAGKKVSYIELLFFALAVVVLVVIPAYTTTYIHMLATIFFMYAVLAVSWNIFSGPSRYLSLGSTAFFGVGIYAAALLSDPFPVPITIVLGGLIAFLVGLFVGLSTLRVKGLYFAIFTFGLGEFLVHIVGWWEVTINVVWIRWVPMIDAVTAYYAMLIVLVAALLTSHIIKSTKFGLVLQSIGESEEATRYMGVNVAVVKIFFFAISCGFMGLAGAIMAQRWMVVEPRMAFCPVISFTVVLMVLVGGMGHRYGALLGAVLLTFITHVLLVGFAHYNLALQGIILIAIVLFVPSGLLGWFARKGVGKSVVFSLGSGWRFIKKLGK